MGMGIEKTPLKNNLIRRDRIHNVMNLLDDGAGIYTMSKQPGTTIVENYVFDIVRSPWAGEFPISGIYLDDYSSLIIVTDNILENVPVGIDFHQAEYNTMINNMASYQERDASHNDFIRKGDFDVEAIKANAGIEEAYATAVPAALLQP